MKQTLLSNSSHLAFKHDRSSAPSPHFIFTTTSSKTQHSHVPPRLQKWRAAIFRSITGVFKFSPEVSDNNNNNNNIFHMIQQTADLTFHDPAEKLLLLLHPHRCLSAVPVGPRTSEGKSDAQPVSWLRSLRCSSCFPWSASSSSSSSLHHPLLVSPSSSPSPLGIAEFPWCVQVRRESSLSAQDQRIDPTITWKKNT